MGCCLFASIIAGAPRLALLIWWVLQPVRMQATFHTWIWPLLGFLFLPWTTIAFIIVAPGGIAGLDWLWLGIGVVIDIASYSGGGYANSRR